jgi:glycosyltransferase involved in cell wall biosynthesis
LARGAVFNQPERYRAAFPDLPTIDIDGLMGTRRARVLGITEAVRVVDPDIVLSARIFDAYPAIAELKSRGNRKVRFATTIQAFEHHYLHDARTYKDFVDLIVTSGELVRKAAVEWCGVASERVVSIPGGVKAPIRPGTPGALGVRRIGYVGRLDPDQKRALDLIDFVRSIEKSGLDATMDIVGSGPAEAELRQALSSETVAGRVRFHGWRTQDELYEEIYPSLDVFVHFAHTEGVTIAPREAMAHGVVPVVSNFIGRAAERQFVDEETALVFPVGDTGRAKDLVLRLHHDPALFGRLSNAARLSQAGPYSADGAIAAWAQAIKHCANSPQLRASAVPKLRATDPGRLSSLGLSELWAHRLRQITGVRRAHYDPGSEWPTGSGELSDESSRELAGIACDDR